MGLAASYLAASIMRVGLGIQSRNVSVSPLRELGPPSRLIGHRPYLALTSSKLTVSPRAISSRAS